MNDADRNLTMRMTLIYFFISLFINALGNGLTIASNLGSALWTASAVNLAGVLPISLANMLIIIGTGGLIINGLLTHSWDIRRIIGNILFMLMFSYLVQAVTRLLLHLGMAEVNLMGRIFFDLAGLIFISVAISIYQRVNLILHPLDDTMQIVRFKFFHGNSVLAQLAIYSIPVVLILIVFLTTHHVEAVGIGTLFALLCQGPLIGYADKLIFPSLKHQGMPSFLRSKHV